MTVSKTALTGGMGVAAFAKFRVSMVTFNKERAPSRPFGCWDLAAMVEMQDSWEKAVWRVSCEEEPEP